MQTTRTRARARRLSLRAAAAALLGAAPITGRLPVSLPPFHARGEGMQWGVMVGAR